MIAGKIREMTDKERGITIWDKELGAYRRAQIRGYCDPASKGQRMGGRIYRGAGDAGDSGGRGVSVRDILIRWKSRRC